MLLEELGFEDVLDIGLDAVVVARADLGVKSKRERVGSDLVGWIDR